MKNGKKREGCDKAIESSREENRMLIWNPLRRRKKKEKQDKTRQDKTRCRMIWRDLKAVSTAVVRVYSPSVPYLQQLFHSIFNIVRNWWPKVHQIDIIGRGRVKWRRGGGGGRGRRKGRSSSSSWRSLDMVHKLMIVFVSIALISTIYSTAAIIIIISTIINIYVSICIVSGFFIFSTINITVLVIWHVVVAIAVARVAAVIHLIITSLFLAVRRCRLKTI